MIFRKKPEFFKYLRHSGRSDRNVIFCTAYDDCCKMI